MFAGSPQHRVRQRTEGDRATLRAKIMDRPVIAERNVVRSDIMVAPLDSIHDTIQTYHWGSLLVCNWLHSVGQNHFFVMMLLNRNSAIQSASRKFCTVYKSEKSDPL
jgi:hypothetical protein